MTFLALRPADGIALVNTATHELVSFAELISRGREIAAHLGQSKEVVFLVAQNDVFSATAYWGAVDAGHAVALLDARAPIESTADLIDVYRPSWIIGPTGLGEQLVRIERGVEPIVALDGGDLVQTATRTRPDVHPDLSLMLTTSGTTGSRKLVRLSIRNVESNAASIAEALDLTSDERPIALLPIHYSFGLSVLNSHWRVGATVVITDHGVLERAFWETFAAERCTSLAGVPYTYQMLERVGFREMDLPALRSLQQAGGALDRRLTEVYRDHMSRRGGRFFVMYGQTEATARIAYVPPFRLADKLGSAGIAIPGGLLRIVSEADADATGANGASSTGEVVYEGPNVMLGYASSAADLARGDDLHGVLQTGDIGYLDDEAFLYLVGRSKRIAKVFGRRVNLDEVEAMIREWGPAAVVGGGDTIWAFCAFGSADEVEGVAHEIAARLRIHHSALRCRRVEAIPTTDSGKVDYRAVQGWIT